MKVSVTYTGQIKTAVGCSREEIDHAGPCTLVEIIRRVAEEHGGASRHLLTVDGTVQRALLLVLNGEQVPGGEDPALSDGDHVAIMPPISGGVDRVRESIRLSRTRSRSRWFGHGHDCQSLSA